MKILGILSIILIVCALICGLWIKFHPQGNDMNFHFLLSLATMLLSLITLLLFVFKK